MRHRLRRSSWAAIALAALLVLVVGGLVACGSGSAATAATRGLTVSAASSLKGAFTDIGKAFDRANNSKTTFNFDASGTLQRQIEAGAPVDVFASAAMKQMAALLDEKLVDEASVKVFASNEIVLVVPTDSTLGITGFQDLAKAEVKKVTYGDPKVAPHGVAAEEILSKIGLFDQVKPKVIFAPNVSAALEYVANGEVDVGVVFATEAKAGGGKVKIVATSDPGWHSKILFPLGVVSAGKSKALAQAFVDFVAGSEGQKILKSYGFLAVPA